MTCVAALLGVVVLTVPTTRAALASLGARSKAVAAFSDAPPAARAGAAPHARHSEKTKRGVGREDRRGGARARGGGRLCSMSPHRTMEFTLSSGPTPTPTRKAGKKKNNSGEPPTLNPPSGF